MTCTVKISNGTIPLPPGVNLPDGVEVQVTFPDPDQSFAEHFKEFIGAAKDLPADFATNIDHYAHGHSKK